MSWNPFDHHRGPFTFVVTRPKVKPRKNEYPFAVEKLPGTTSGADVEDEARALLTDPRDSIISVAVWSVTEQQHIVTFRKDDPVRSRVAAPIEDAAKPDGIPSDPATLHKALEAVGRKMGRNNGVPKPERRTRGAKLVIGKADGWPASKGAQIVLQFFRHPERQATAHEIVAAIGDQLTSAGIEFPGSLVSRLKQAGFLTEAA